MDEECVSRGLQKFRRHDYVAVASKAACSKVRRINGSNADFDTSWFLDEIAIVESVSASGNVAVRFEGDIRCTIEPGALLKMRDLWHGDLVKIVDDIRGDGNLKLEAESSFKSVILTAGDIWAVLGGSKMTQPYVTVELDGNRWRLSRLQVEFVARPICGKITIFLARTFAWPSREEELFEALQECMQDMCDVDVLSGRPPSQFAPGDLVKVSGDLAKFITWRLDKHKWNLLERIVLTSMRKKADITDGGSPYFQAVEESKHTLATLLKPGKVVQVHSDGEAIVDFPDGTVWRIPPCFLEFFVGGDANGQGARSRSPNLLLEVGLCARRCDLRNASLKLSEAALFLSCCSGNIDNVMFLLDGNVGLECTDKNGSTPLHYAAYGNRPEIIQFLLISGANINATNKTNHTALQFAIKENCVDSVRELTKQGITPNANIRDDLGNTALHAAITNMNAEIIEELVKLPNLDFSFINKYGLNSLQTAALIGNVAATEAMLAQRDGLVNHEHEDRGYAALHFAAVRGHYGVVETLLKQESCIVDLESKHKETALFLAASKGHCSVVELLLLAGANINKRDRHGDTPLHVSMKKANERLVKPLDGTTSRAMNAVEKQIKDHGHSGVSGRLLLASFLVRSGADIHCSNEAGITPLNLACNLQEPAVELFDFFSAERGTVDSRKCRNCLEAYANTSFAPCGHCLYCDDCGRRMTRCCFCGILIVARVPTAAGSATPNEVSPYKLQVVPAKEITKGPGIYRMTRNPRGTCIIINNADFNTQADHREGSELDADRMKDLFTQFLFRVTVESNLSAIEITHLLRDVSRKESQQDAECLVVILMSHGKEGIVYGSDGEKVHLERHVYQPFNNDNCPALQGKPKIFFVQACQGDEWDNGTNDVREMPDTPQGAGESIAATCRQPYKRMPGVSDMYIAYATIPGYVALRNARTGSWFLSAVSEVFSEHACSTSLDGLMREVHEKVMKCSAHDGSKQTPRTCIDGWTKELYFNPGLWF